MVIAGKALWPFLPQQAQLGSPIQGARCLCVARGKPMGPEHLLTHWTTGQYRQVWSFPRTPEWWPDPSASRDAIFPSYLP